MSPSKRSLLKLAPGLLASQLLILSLLIGRVKTQGNLLKRFSSEACQRLPFVSRAQWGAGRPSGVVRGFRDVAGLDGRAQPSRVFLHQAGDGFSCYEPDSCSRRVRAIQAYHQHVKRWPDISYNFLISADGLVYEGLGFRQVGFHTLNYNERSLGVAFIGSFEDVRPPARMLEALDGLLECALAEGLLPADFTIHGHRDARCTSCPGEAAYSVLRASFPARFRPGPLPLYSCPAELGALQPGPRTLHRRSPREPHEEPPEGRQPINKKPKQIILVNVAAKTQDGTTSSVTQASSQPLFYLVTKSKGVAPTIAITPLLLTSGGQQSGSGGGLESAGGGQAPEHQQSGGSPSGAGQPNMDQQQQPGGPNARPGSGGGGSLGAGSAGGSSGAPAPEAGPPHTEMLTEAATRSRPGEPPKNARPLARQARLLELTRVSLL